MTGFIALISTLFIGAVLVSLILLLLALAVLGKDWIERTVRLLSISMGFIAYYGSMVLGVSLPALLYQAAETGGLLKSSIVAILLPAIVGFAMSAFIAKALRQRGDRQVKTLLLIGTLVFCAFGDIFASNVLNKETYADFRRKINETERTQTELRGKLQSSDSGTYSDTDLEKTKKRQAIETEIARLDGVRTKNEQIEKRLLVTLLGPNITFVLSLLSYLVFVFDRAEIDRLRRAKPDNEFWTNPLVEATASGMAPDARKARYSQSALSSAEVTPSVVPHKKR